MSKREAIVKFRAAETVGDVQGMREAFDMLLTVCGINDIRMLMLYAEAESDDWQRVGDLIARGRECEKREIEAIRKQVQP